MRQAKLSRTAARSEEAQIKAYERSVALAQDVNRKTNHSVQRSIEASRSMERHAALESSAASRAGKKLPGETPERQFSDTQKAEVEAALTQRASVSINNRVIVAKRRTQAEPNAAINDSIPPGYRRVMDRGVPKIKNDPTPRFNAQAERPSLRTNKLVAHGISQNPAEEARRRKKLEARIRELAAE